jgi:hypothetical protein
LKKHEVQPIPGPQLITQGAVGQQRLLSPRTGRIGGELELLPLRLSIEQFGDL